MPAWGAKVTNCTPSVIASQCFYCMSPCVPITWEANVWVTGPTLDAPRFPTWGHHSCDYALRTPSKPHTSLAHPVPLKGYMRRIDEDRSIARGR